MPQKNLLSVFIRVLVNVSRNKHGETKTSILQEKMFKGHKLELELHKVMAEICKNGGPIERILLACNFEIAGGRGKERKFVRVWGAGEFGGTRHTAAADDIVNSYFEMQQATKSKRNAVECFRKSVTPELPPPPPPAAEEDEKEGEDDESVAPAPPSPPVALLFYRCLMCM